MLEGVMAGSACFRQPIGVTGPLVSVSTLTSGNGSALRDWCPVQHPALEAVTQEERQTLLWQDLFFHSELWWDSRKDKRSPRHPDFRHKRSKEALWLDNRHKPAWVDSQLATWDARVRIGVTGLPGFSNSIKVCEEAELADSVKALEILVHQGSHVDTSLFYRLLKRCIAQKDLVLGRRLHGLTLKCGYESDVFLANHIIRMYASHGRLHEATQVFIKVAPDNYVWASVISAYSQHGQPGHAIKLYRQMRGSPLTPNNHVFSAVLKACTIAADLAAGKEVLADILASAIEMDTFVGNSLVDMFSKCGDLDSACRVFERLPSKDLVTWNAMIAGYVQHGLGQEALALYASMQQESSIRADHFTLTCLLQACASIGDGCQGKQIHLEWRGRGLKADLVVGASLVNMYVKCGCVEDAREVFDQLPKRDVVTWTSMIAGYAQSGLFDEALALYSRMQQHSLSPDCVTFVCLLQACASVRALEKGKQLHAQIQERRLEADLVVGNGLVDMYAKCGSLEDARSVFDRLCVRDVVTWNAMIAGYAQHGFCQEALAVYSIMQLDGITEANHVTFVCLLQACGSVGALHQGKHLHTQIQERGMESNDVVGNSLVNMYAKCGSLEDARSVFDRMSTRDVVTWNTMIAGYTQRGLGQEALALYSIMQQDGMVSANHVTYMSLLQACAAVGALHQGKQLHEQIQQQGLEAHVCVGSCLVDLYAKCGHFEDARRVFDSLPTKNVVTWNAMINGYAQNSDTQQTMQCFEKMRQQGVDPDDATFSGLLTACSHKGLVVEGKAYYKMMVDDYRIAPTAQHLACMVDLLGRSGCLAEAENVLQSESCAVGWTSLLSACKSYGDIERGRRCFDRLVELDPEHASAYVLLGNLYANAGRWRDVERLESLRKSAGAKKKAAKACIEVKNKLHEFTVGEGKSDSSSRLRSMNSRLKDEGGHVPHAELVLKPLSDTQKEDALCGHAEKLALAYGLMNTAVGTTLLVTKNLRMCGDCHNSTKIMSRVEKREIIVRDGHRVHRFVDGFCSCGDRH